MEGADEGPVPVELLRFVTAYGVGLEAAVDLTPYSPLLSATAAHGPLEFYAFIDTWVWNQTQREVVLVSKTGECDLANVSAYGNGWALSADLVFWPRQPSPPSSAHQGHIRAGRHKPIDTHDTRPRAMVTLESGCCRGDGADLLPFGGIAVHEGEVSGGHFVPAKPATDLRGAEAAAVFACPDGEAGLRRAGLAGYIAEVTRAVGRSPGRHGQAVLDSWRDVAFETLLLPELYLVAALQNLSSNLTSDFPSSLKDGVEDVIDADFDGSSATLKAGMPLYFMPNEAFVPSSGRVRQAGLSWKPYPLKPAGHVLAVGNGTLRFRLISSLNSTSCRPGRHSVPRFLVPSGPGVAERANAILDAALHWGLHGVSAPAPAKTALEARCYGERTVRHHCEESGHHDHDCCAMPGAGGCAGGYHYFQGKQCFSNGAVATCCQEAGHDASKAVAASGARQGREGPRMPFLLADGGRAEANSSGRGLRPVEPRAWLRLQGSAPDLGKYPLKGGTSSTRHGGANSDRLCAVSVREQGRILSRSFELPRFVAAHGDRAVLQLSVTGHGWSDTTDECAEFCHAVYRISINGEVAFNVTQFRSDCDRNPIDGEVQRGTWNESRNGWCPGSVEPGVFVDATKWTRQKNRLDLDVLVWNSAKKAYRPYTDFAGFAFDVGGEQPRLAVGLTAFVYGAPAVEAVLAQPRPRTAAESALRRGSSHPEALRPAERVLTEHAAEARRLWDPNRYIAGVDFSSCSSILKVNTGVVAVDPATGSIAVQSPNPHCFPGNTAYEASIRAAIATAKTRPESKHCYRTA